MSDEGRTFYLWLITHYSSLTTELEMIDNRGELGGAKTVVDVHHGQSGATVEHGQERGDSAKVSAVSDAGRDADDGHGHQSRDNAGQRAFHAGGHDDDTRFHATFAFGKQAMQTRYSNVIKTHGCIAEQIGRHVRFFGNGQIGCPGSHNKNLAFACDLGFLANRYSATT